FSGQLLRLQDQKACQSGVPGFRHLGEAPPLLRGGGPPQPPPGTNRLSGSGSSDTKREAHKAGGRRGGCRVGSEDGTTARRSHVKAAPSARRSGGRDGGGPSPHYCSLPCSCRKGRTHFGFWPLCDSGQECPRELRAIGGPGWHDAEPGG